jgi:D-alanyl-D-alanine dipeptidase
LLEAQKLLPNDLRFCLYEGYRSLSLQEKLFNDRYNIVKDRHPDWNHQQIFQETIRLVSPVINFDGSRNIPPHSTGAAIDVYLVDQAGNIVDMGIKAADWMKDIDGSISQTNSSKISEQAKKHRAIMSHALQAVGFVNYPAEYWHWSYGDKYWAYHVGSKVALYGTVK